MKKIGCLVMALAILCMACYAAAELQFISEAAQDIVTEGYPYVGWTLKKSNIRRKPSTGSSLLGELPKGEEVIVLRGEEQENGTLWYEIEYAAGKKGYVRGDLLDVRMNVDPSVFLEDHSSLSGGISSFDLSLEEIRTMFIRNLGDSPAWNCDEIEDVGEDQRMFRVTFCSGEGEAEVYQRITEKGQHLVCLRMDAFGGVERSELLKTAKRIHDGGAYGWYLSEGDFIYSDFWYLCGNLLRVFTTDLDYGVVGDERYNFIERTIAVGYEDAFVYHFESDAFAGGQGDHFTRVGNCEICFSIRGTQLELAVRKQASGNAMQTQPQKMATEQNTKELELAVLVTTVGVRAKAELEQLSDEILEIGLQVEVLDRIDSDERTWKHIRYGEGMEGYILDWTAMTQEELAGQQKKNDEAASSAVKTTGYPCPGISIKSAVNVRKTADPSGVVVTRIRNGELLNVLGEQKNGNTLWYHVQLNGGKKGYIRADLIQLGAVKTLASQPSSAYKQDMGKTGDSNSQGQNSGSKKPKACSTCGGDGKVTSNCSACSGSGKVLDECFNCGGDGLRRCGACGTAGYKRCTACGGKGYRISGKNQKICYRCDGVGQLLCGRCWGSGYDDCAICSGRGYRKTNCDACDGSGKVTKKCPSCR